MIAGSCCNFNPSKFGRDLARDVVRRRTQTARDENDLGLA